MSAPEPQVIHQPSDRQAGLLDVLEVVAANIKLLTIGPLLIGLAALAVAFVVTPTYTGTTQFLPPLQQSAAASILQSLGGDVGSLVGAATGLKNPNDKYVSMLKSNSVQDALIARFKLMDRYEAKFKEDARLTLEKNTRVTSGKDNLITIEVDDHEPAVAADMANAYVAELATLLDRLSLTEAQSRRRFFEKQLQQTKGSLVKAEQALQSSGVNLSALKTSPDVALTAVTELQARVAAQEIKLASMRGFLTESAPEMRAALSELSALRAQMAKVEAETGKPRGAGQADYVARYRDFKYYETLFELFSKQYELARVDEAREGAVVQIVDKAQPPERRSKPKRALTAILATIGGGILLLVFVFLRQAIRNSAQDPRNAAKIDRIRRGFGFKRSARA
jgi:tyrosine-protein kinase Etk/Wzc